MATRAVTPNYAVRDMSDVFRKAAGEAVYTLDVQ
jgi:hypothetical protein